MELIVPPGNQTVVSRVSALTQLSYPAIKKKSVAMETYLNF